MTYPTIMTRYLPKLDRRAPNFGKPLQHFTERVEFRMEFAGSLRARPSVEEMATVVSKSRAGAAVSAINAAIFTLATWSSLGGAFQFWWCCVVVLLSSHVALRSRRAESHVVGKVSARAARRLVGFSILMAAPWGLLSMVSFGVGTSFDRLMILCVCTGMTAGATFILYRTLAACLAYYATVLVPLCAACLLADPAGLWPVALYSLVFGGYLACFAANIGLAGRERDASVAALSSTVAELEKAHQRISHLAFFDTVTGLPNRSAYTERLAREVETAAAGGKGFAVLMLDLDRFKTVNDTLGHDFGDRLLGLVGRRLSDRLRPEDMLARLGGDEFAIIVPGVDRRSFLHDLAARLIDALSEPAWLDGRQVFPGTSVGMACYPENGTTAEDILLKADIALNRAKELGRGQFVVFDNSLRARLTAEDWLAGELRQALCRQEIRMQYQPKIDISTGRMFGAEALVRWTHAEEGPIAPDRFLPVAAERGLLPQLTRVVIDQVCRDMLQWRRDGVEVGKIAINIHPSDLMAPVELLANLKSIVSRGICPKDVVLEVTEGCFVGGGSDTAPIILDAINDLGFDISLDDFGMGYASLSHLRKLPVSEIKIDRSFVTGLCENRHDRAIVAATIEIARGMGLRLVAEGVETAAQRDLLLELGAGFGQGYLWSKSVPPEELAVFAATSGQQRGICGC